MRMVITFLYAQEGNSMGVVDFAEYLKSAIQAGSAVEGNVVKIIADNGDEIGDAVFKVIQGGNGNASEVAVATQTGAGGAVATGLAYLSLEVGVVGAAIAPALGIAAGIGLYNLAPEFWDNVSNTLVNAGKTVGGKVIAYWNGDNAYYDHDVIEIFKNAFAQMNIFSGDNKYSDITLESVDYPIPISNRFFGLRLNQYNFYYWCDSGVASGWYAPDIPRNTYGQIVASSNQYAKAFSYRDDYNPPATDDWDDSPLERTYTYDGRTVYYLARTGDYQYPFNPYSPSMTYKNGYRNIVSDDIGKIAWTMVYGNGNRPDIPLQPTATYPEIGDDFTTTYPDWYPLTYDPTLPDPSELPDVYPLKYPVVGPDGLPEQDPAQNPDPESVPDIYPVIEPNFPIPNPGLPEPQPEPEPDPDPQPEPDPIPEDEPVEPEPDPVNPNPDPDPSIPIVVPPLPNTVSSNKLFTVYNPSSSQLDALGGYLWDASIIAAIRDIWQEPMDGLISLQQVFVTPTTSGNHNIILGFLDSGVSAPVVSNQFVTVDCGSVQVEEDKKNATDYSPYTSLNLYLPFIGIVELDVNECMNGTISIKYKVDVYTGTCLAQVSIDRDVDMPNDPILYTFSGNCSQQLPLTSGNSVGLLTALIGAVGAGIKASTGGALSTLAGAQLLGNSLSHEMMHVSHSGNLSANAGIMGQKKPYLIIGRRHCYDANDYNSFYGYPANKTIVMGNHTGFVRVKKCWIKTSALQEEYKEIMRLLDEGIYL